MVRDMLKKGKFNHMAQYRLPDGSLKITLTRLGNPHKYTLIVLDLYEPTEKIISQKIDDKEIKP